MMSSTGLARILDEQGRRRMWVARKLGVDPTTVTLWCQGKREIPPARVVELAELLGVSPAEIRERKAAA